MAEELKQVVIRPGFVGKTGICYTKESLQKIAEDRPDFFYIDEEGNLCTTPEALKKLLEKP